LHLTITTYEADGIQREFVVPFVYIKKEYVKAYRAALNSKGHVVGERQPLGFSWLNAGLIRLDNPVPPGNQISVERETYADKPLVDFQDAAIVTEQDLDLATQQMLHVAQEARDRNGLNLTIAMQFFQTLQDELARVVAAGEETQARLEELIVEVRERIVEMEELLRQTLEARDKAEAARDAEYWARQWASQSPGVEVRDGEYSAKHYADRARADNGDLGGHVDAYDPHPQYLRKDQAGSGIFEKDANGDIQIRENIDDAFAESYFYHDAWGDIALFD
jgi:hypothetical protein